MAVEILIRMIDGPGDRRAGNIIAIRPHPHQGWGAGERLPLYAVVRIVNVTFSAMEGYHRRHDGYTDAEHIIWRRRSKYRIDIAALPAAMRNALMAVGFYELQNISGIQGAIVLNDYINVGTEEEPAG